jgi:hypothetical protein
MSVRVGEADGRATRAPFDVSLDGIRFDVVTLSH